MATKKAQKGHYEIIEDNGNKTKVLYSDLTLSQAKKILLDMINKDFRAKFPSIPLAKKYCRMVGDVSYFSHSRKSEISLWNDLWLKSR